MDVVALSNDRLFCRYGWGVTLDAETSAIITGYRPQKAPPEWDRICGHVRMLVAASADRSPYRVERLLTATARLAVWSVRRLRSSWIVELLSARIDLGVVAAAAGMSASALARYQHFVSALDQPTAVALLRGRPDEQAR